MTRTPQLSHDQIRHLCDDIAAIDIEFGTNGTSPAALAVLAIRQLLAEVEALQARVDCIGKWLGGDSDVGA